MFIMGEDKKLQLFQGGTLKASNVMIGARILILGSKRVGKSALTVRFLTKRFIGEYTSDSDLLYKDKKIIEQVPVSMELMDCSSSQNVQSCPTLEQLQWADAFVVVYSVCDRDSFEKVNTYMNRIKNNKLPNCASILILGNKTDLDHYREVSYEEGAELSKKFGCLFHEVSAAENYKIVHNAFIDLIKDLAEVIRQRSLKRRKSSLRNVSKALVSMFGVRSSVQKDSSPKMTVIVS